MVILAMWLDPLFRTYGQDQGMLSEQRVSVATSASEIHLTNVT